MPDFAKIALPLTELTKAKLPQIIEWRPEQQTAFNTLKTKLCERPLLRTPVWDRPFIIQADASGLAVAACLAQLFDAENGKVKEHPIAYASRKLQMRSEIGQ